MPDMYSSSESIPIVRGVGGSAFAAAEATPLFGFFEGFEDAIASAAFLFLSWEEIVSTVRTTRLCRSSLGDHKAGGEWCDSMVTRFPAMTVN
jgi:hypothetical protein